MNIITEKAKEFVSYLWVKLIALIPLCFFDFNDREKIAVFALLIIMMFDCILGVMKASYVDRNFNWNLLGKKFSLKFILFFLFLGASFVLSKAFSLVGFWFYAATALVAFSEFGSLSKKAQALGLPIKSDIISALNCKIENYVLGLLAVRPITVETMTESFEKNKAEDLKAYNTEKAVAVKEGNIERAKKEKKFVENTATKRAEFLDEKKHLKKV